MVSQSFELYPDIKFITPQAQKYPAEPFVFEIETTRTPITGYRYNLVNHTGFQVMRGVPFSSRGNNRYTHSLTTDYIKMCSGYDNKDMRIQVYDLADSSHILGISPLFSIGTLQTITVAESVLDLKLGTAGKINVTGKGASNNHVLYSSERSAIARVDVNGNVTPVSVGTTRIILNQNGMGEYLDADPCYVTVNVTKPVDVYVNVDTESVSSLPTGVSIQWKADGNTYDVMRSDTRDGIYELIQESYTSGSTFLDTRAVPGKRYYYRLRQKN